MFTNWVHLNGKSNYWFVRVIYYELTKEATEMCKWLNAVYD